ncbi:hypothetical protein, partial [uncultured Rikenella sp.]|uniref:hypothetical protein n=1 Tax=uncultured Rikenella sp. TaxID=368003 RepID=UPI002618D169
PLVLRAKKKGRAKVFDSLKRALFRGPKSQKFRYCTEIALGCASILGSLSGSLSSEREQFHTVLRNKCQNSMII